MNEELFRYLAACVVQLGGEARLSHEERVQAFDLELTLEEDTDVLVVRAKVET